MKKKLINPSLDISLSKTAFFTETEANPLTEIRKKIAENMKTEAENKEKKKKVSLEVNKFTSKETNKEVNKFTSKLVSLPTDLPINKVGFYFTRKEVDKLDNLISKLKPVIRDRYKKKVTKYDIIRACFIIGLKDWEENQLTGELVNLLINKE